MDEHDYVYQLRPLIVPALMFLILYPLIIGGVDIFRNLPIIEVRVLIGIYVTATLGILALWVMGKSKRVQIEDQQIVFRSVLGLSLIHISEPTRLGMISYAVFCLKKK